MDFVARAAVQWPQRVAVAWDDQQWSYAALHDQVDARVTDLIDAGAEPGEPVAVHASPTLECVVGIHAVLRLGGVVCPLGAHLTDAEREAALEALGARFHLDAGGSPRALHTESAPDPRPRGSSAKSPAHLPTAQAAAVLWTSGTTGSPRGVVLSAAAFETIAEASKERLGLGPDDVWYGALSPAHVGGLALILRAAWLGSSVVLAPSFDAGELATMLMEGRVTHASLVPTMLRRLVDAWGGGPVPESVGALLIGGAATPSRLVERSLAVGFPLALTYGLSEATSQVATASPGEVRAKPGSAGRPLQGVEVTIEESTGEILVSGPTVALGFWSASGPLVSCVDAGGRLHTGDLGRVDADGDLWVTGRMSDRIISGGATVDPHEVEQVLLAHPAVAEAGVVGVPDEEWGERVVAAVVWSAAAPSERDFADYVAARLSAAKRPKNYVEVSELPRNANGKVDRARLTELVSRAL